MIRAENAPAGLGDALAMTIGGWAEPPKPLSAAEQVVLAAGYAHFTAAQRDQFRALCVALPREEWRTVQSAANAHNMANLLWSHLAQEELAEVVLPDRWEDLRQGYQSRLLTQMRLAHTLREALVACEAAHIRAMPLKGPTLGLRIYGAQGPRPSRDLDLFIDARVTQRRAYRVLAPLFAQWEARQVRVELAWALIHRPAYRSTLNPHAIWQRAVPATFRDIPCYQLAAGDELRYLCAHHVVHHQASEWLWMVDIAELLGQHAQAPAWDWPTFVAETIASETALPVVLAFMQAQALLGAPVPPFVIAALASAAQSKAEQGRWAAMTIPMPSVRGAVTLVRAAHSVGEITTIARTLVWPDRTYLREYHDWVPGQRVAAARLRRLRHITRNVLPGPKIIIKGSDQ